ncbi:MAG: hypothetical protein A2140_08705 [Candidatus Muproteobacteria bacterium RBG_16_62_13]|uniref:Cell envelope integrity protein CreD n=1 Tax=Candidatus Muproteobacteria bacterium RBG_16_62_13 TaxID=1817756 RepID=A0A1F6T5Z7_9PROT|nr:MAG: hypothetical protein A2140_08705 [Candidatus Muproteobacteria bacterium RBG_16_62_13]
MFKKLLAIAFIFFCTSIAWMILGGTLFARTYVADSSLKHRVQRIWGDPQAQTAPTISYTTERLRAEKTQVDGKTVTKFLKHLDTHCLPLVGSDIKVNLHLDHRQKGLLWYATYAVKFSGAYQFQNNTGQDRLLTVSFPFPSQSSIYDGFAMKVRHTPWAKSPESVDGQVRGVILVRTGETVTVDVAYGSQGMDRWSYRLTTTDKVAELRNFRLEIQTDFNAIDFPEDTLSPTHKERSSDGWRLTWRYTNLLSGANIGVLMPQKLQPGPLAAEISFFAPVSLFFFFVVMLVITLVRRIELHPMHYFFLSAAFFAFHLLLAYLVDHLSIHLAFAAASLVSVALVVSYLRLAVGSRFAFVEAGAAQIVYLVLFSYAFFFRGFTGLAITVGAILTLFVLMQITARIRWNEVFTKRP